MIALIINISIPLVLIVGGYLIGSTVERNHFRSLTRRESQFKDIVVTNLKELPNLGPVSNAAYVDGQAVIGSDYFKTIAAALRGLLGGRMRSLESLMLRARREALVRLLEQARALGATHVLNVRLETSNIGRGSRNKGLIMAEVHAFGTALSAGSPREQA